MKLLRLGFTENNNHRFICQNSRLESSENSEEAISAEVESAIKLPDAIDDPGQLEEAEKMYAQAIIEKNETKFVAADTKLTQFIRNQGLDEFMVDNLTLNIKRLHGKYFPESDSSEESSGMEENDNYGFPALKKAVSVLEGFDSRRFEIDNRYAADSKKYITAVQQILTFFKDKNNRQNIDIDTDSKIFIDMNELDQAGETVGKVDGVIGNNVFQALRDFAEAVGLDADVIRQTGKGKYDIEQDLTKALIALADNNPKDLPGAQPDKYEQRFLDLEGHVRGNEGKITENKRHTDGFSDHIEFRNSIREDFKKSEEDMHKGILDIVETKIVENLIKKGCTSADEIKWNSSSEGTFHIEGDQKNVIEIDTNKWGGWLAAAVDDYHALTEAQLDALGLEDKGGIKTGKMDVKDFVDRIRPDEVKSKLIKALGSGTTKEARVNSTYESREEYKMNYKKVLDKMKDLKELDSNLKLDKTY